jgi:hypothetical protein
MVLMSYEHHMITRTAHDGADNSDAHPLGFHAFMTQTEDWQSHLMVTNDGAEPQPYSASSFGDLFKGTTMTTAHSAR